MPTWNGGPKCVTHEFRRPFAARPDVQASVVRGSERGAFPTHAVAFWVADVTATAVHVCVDDHSPEAPRRDFEVHFVAVGRQASA